MSPDSFSEQTPEEIEKRKRVDRIKISLQNVPKGPKMRADTDRLIHTLVTEEGYTFDEIKLAQSELLSELKEKMKVIEETTKRDGSLDSIKPYDPSRPKSRKDLAGDQGEDNND